MSRRGGPLRVVAHNGAHIWGGGERAMALILAGLAARGHRVLLLCASRRVAEGARALGVPAQRVRLGGQAMLPHALGLARRLRRLRPDVFLIGTYRKVFLASLAGRLAGVPRVLVRVGLQSHGPSRFTYRWALRRWADEVVVNAAAMAPGFAGHAGRRRRVTVIPNGVRPPVASGPPGAVRLALGIPPGAPVVGTVARLVSQKRLDRLVQAVALLGPETHLVIAGEGSRRQEILAEAHARGITERVHLLGHRPDVGDVLAALDAYAVSSDTEGMSNAMLEAMAFGLPVVSTEVSGAAEALRAFPDGRSPGAVVPHDAGSLAAALRPLLDDAALRRAAGAAARARIQEEFSYERTIDRWETLLGENA